MTTIFGVQRFSSAASLLGLILGLIFGMLSLGYFDDSMTRAGVLAVCALWGTVTGVAIARSIPRSCSTSPCCGNDLGKRTNQRG